VKSYLLPDGVQVRGYRLAVVLGVILVIFVTGCYSIPTSPTIDPIQTPSPRSILQPTKTTTTSLDTKIDSDSREDIPSEAVCVTPKFGVKLPEIEFLGYPEAILEFLNSGGSAQELDQELYSSGIANQPLSVASFDLTGNSINEVVISIIDPQSSAIVPGGTFLIYMCQEDGYRLQHRQDSPDNQGAYGIRYLQDLNSDGLGEVVISSPNCGAHTCFEDVQVLSWQGGDIVNLLVGNTDELPSPDIRIIDSDADGIFDIEVGSGGFNSVGAGPNRTKNRHWAYNQATSFWDTYEDIPGSSFYRIHVLHDAEDAAQVENFDQALIDYGRVVYDPNLVDWQDPEQEIANLSAYSLYKIAVLHLIQGVDDRAAITFELLEKNYASEGFGYMYAELAALFREGYELEGLVWACEIAQEFAQNHSEEILSPLGSEIYGYANRDYFPKDICPWE
jgi:hypothetical protein